MILVCCTSCLSTSIDAYYSTETFDDGVSLRLKKDNSFSYDEWSDCGLDRTGTGTYTIEGDELELSFDDYDSIEIKIISENLEEGMKIKISIEPQYEEAYSCYKFIKKDSSDHRNCNHIKSKYPIISIPDNSHVLRIYNRLERFRFDSIDYNLVEKRNGIYSKSILYSDPNYRIHQDSTWIWRIKRRKIEMHNSPWEMKKVKNRRGLFLHNYFPTS